MKTAGKAGISITRAKSTEVGLKEMESDKACTRVICKKSYEIGSISTVSNFSSVLR